MNGKELIKKIEEKFYKALDKKTNWGRNELKMEFQMAKAEAILEMIDDEDIKDK